MNPLLKILNHILNRIKVDLIIGSANKKIDLERTSSWSDEAVSHTREIAVYEKSNKKYAANFFKFRVCAQEDILQYVTEGANGKFSRAGNCQEHVGLALYYLFHHSELWNRIDIITFDECFDHVFLRIRSKNKEIYYFDSWSELIFTQPNKENLNKITDIIIDGYRAQIKQTESKEEVNELEGLIGACNKILKVGPPSISKELSYSPKKSKEFIGQFDSYYNLLLKSSYSSSL